MKRFYVLLICISSFILTSCNFTEEITFNPDGSGEFLMNYDMSEVMKTLEEMGGGKKDDENKEKTKLDSVIYFKDMIAERSDSIAKLPQEEQDRFKAMENIVMRIKMDEDTGAFNLGLGSTFTSLEELPATLESIQEAKNFNSKDNAQFSKMGESVVAKSAEGMFEYVDFAYDGKTFSRTIKEGFKQSPEDMEALDAEINQMGESESMFKNMTYTLVYHFPKPIKNATNKQAVISEDRKTVTLKMNFLEAIKSPELMALDVVLED